MKLLIVLIILATAFFYIRGSMQIIKSEKVNCQWHLVYAFCEGKVPQPPSFLDALKAGMRF